MSTATAVQHGKAPTTWARPEIGAFGLAVLTILAMHANRAGACVVRQSRLAQMLGVHRSRISREIARLTEMGEIIKTLRHDRDGWRLACAYVLPAVAALHTRCAGAAQQEQIILEQDTLSPPQDIFVTSRKENIQREARAMAGRQAEPSEMPATVPPADWQPSAEDLAYAAAHRPDVDPVSVTRKFLVYHRSEGGRAVRDVSAVWRMWMERERVPGRRKPAAAGVGQGAAAPAPAAPRPAPTPIDPVTVIRKAGPGLVMAWRQEAARRRPDLTREMLASPEILATIIPDIVTTWRPTNPYAAPQ